ncbi:MAG TPA: glycosyltransferase family 4 protein [Acidimicrobiales bacterium]|nr:glycosyltransferase family 4 protein [Acidimicrobiales bacterium]
MTHLLVTNDFPPKIGGIQSYLYELWRRLPAGRFGVLTIATEGAANFDLVQDFPIRRLPVKMLMPTRKTRREIDRYAHEIGATHVVLDPVFPIGLIGPRLECSYSLVAHGAEVAIPSRIPIARQMIRRSIARSDSVIAAGGYPAREVSAIGRDRTPRLLNIPPGVDMRRFSPLGDVERLAARRRFGISDHALCVVSVSRLVPRKGMDVLIRAAGHLLSHYPNLEVVIGGTGRDAQRLARLIENTGAPVRLLGRVADEDLAPLIGCADVAAMLCRNRWLGLEQEGFGIVFLEAAAVGIPAIAGDSGGAREAVVDHETGLVVMQPTSVANAVKALDELLGDLALRERFGIAGRARLEVLHDYDRLATELDRLLRECEHD